MPTVLHELGLDTSGLDGTALADRDGSAAALTFQGWNEQAYHFSLTLPNRRLLLELDHPEPRRARRFLLGDVTDLHDVSLVGGAGNAVDDSYDRVLADLPAILAQMPFLEL
jgi:hypothetical protein